MAKEVTTLLGGLLIGATFMADHPARSRVNHLKDKITEVTAGGLRNLRG